jgi:hypothetical protein
MNPIVKLLFNFDIVLAQLCTAQESIAMWIINYVTWSVKLDMLLIHSELFGVVDGFKLIQDPMTLLFIITTQGAITTLQKEVTNTQHFTCSLFSK